MHANRRTQAPTTTTSTDPPSSRALMFWRFSANAGSDLDGLLERDPPPTMDEVLDEPDVLTEVKNANPKLVDLLARPASIAALLAAVTADLDPPRATSQSDADLAARRRAK